MKSKKQISLDNLSRQHCLKCIHCDEALLLDQESLKCSNHHVFDVAKKGYVHLAKNSVENIYHLELFKNRRAVLCSLIFEEFIEVLRSILKTYIFDQAVVIDCGTGEGTFLSKLASQKSDSQFFGLDLDKSGVEYATDYLTEDVSMLVANLAELPFLDKSVDVVLNILSPASYNEFRRVLKLDGYIVKVIPGSNYLRELREIAVEEGMLSKAEYDNSDTVTHFEKNVDVIEKKKVVYTIDIENIDLKKALSQMTPMMENVELSNEVLEKLKKITIDLEIYIGKVFEG